MATDVIDFSGLETAASAIETPAEVTEVETPAEGAESATTEVSEKNADGTEKTPEQIEAAKADKEKAALPGNKTTPDNIRKTLKAIRDSAPENAAAVKELHGSYERWNAAKEIFPKGVAEMKEAKQFIDLVGGHEGFEGLQETVAGIKASDEMLYAGDPKLLDNIIEDLKSEGKLESFGKLAAPFFDKLKQVDEPGYYKAMAPHFLAGIEEVELPGVIANILKTLTIPEGADSAALTAALAQAKKLVGGMDKWYKDLKGTADKAKAEAVNPERQKLEDEKKQWNEQKTKAQEEDAKKFTTDTVEKANKTNRTQLGAELTSYLKMPFFKGFTKENLTPLAQNLQSDLRSALSADKIYQAQTKLMLKDKTPEGQAKLLKYHEDAVSTKKADIVRTAVQRMYPGYAKGGAAAGRIAAAASKKEDTKKTDAAAAATGKPVYVPTKPAWDSIDWDKDPKQMLYITGKAYLKGTGKLVTWRR